MSAAFEKIIQGLGLYDHWIDVQGNHLDDAEQWTQHVVQSVVWSAAGTTCNGRFFAFVYIHAGCEKLAVIEENIVTAFAEVGGDSNGAITITLNRAYRVRFTALRKYVL